MNEAKALRLLQQGSQEGLQWFIDRYTPYVSTVVYHILGAARSVADIEEVTADVFYTFWCNADKVRLASVRGYLGSIARSKAKNKFREGGYALSLDEDLYICEDLSLEQRHLESELQELVKREVLAMKQPERELLLRYYYYCQPIATIAQETGMTAANVKVRLHRARNMLRSTLTTYISD